MAREEQPGPPDDLDRDTGWFFEHETEEIPVDDPDDREPLEPPVPFPPRPALPAGPPPPPPPPMFPESEFAGLRYDAAGLPVGPRQVLPLDVEPSPLVARYLFPTERYRGEWRRHWIHLFTEIAVGVLATFALGYLSGVFAQHHAQVATGGAAVVWLLVMGWVGWRWLDWNFDRFVLTNKRVLVVKGLVTREVAMMPLARVTDMKYEQSALGRMLNYGTFVIESAGQDQALRTVPHLPNPNGLYLKVVEEMYEPEAVEARLGRREDAGDDGS